MPPGMHETCEQVLLLLPYLNVTYPGAQEFCFLLVSTFLFYFGFIVHDLGTVKVTQSLPK